MKTVTATCHLCQRKCYPASEDKVWSGTFSLGNDRGYASVVMKLFNPDNRLRQVSDLCSECLRHILEAAVKTV